MTSKPNNRFKADFETIVFDNQSFADFDAWMTRQVNCLVGRNLRFTSPQSASSKSSSRGGSRVAPANVAVTTER